ncbi:MAG: proton-conducting transporter membrane subunit [Clostridia bacterium]|nr:proton-conducting transporter membrane subunit [Clostridia bacterium]
MSFFVNLPLFMIVACLICSVACSVVKSRVAHHLSMTLAWLLAAANICVLVMGIQNGKTVTYMMGHFPRPWGNEIQMGILEPLFSAAFSVIMCLTLIGGRKHIIEDIEKDKRNLYFVMVNLIQAALVVLCYSNDIFTGYVFIEICTLASCGILMIRNVGRTTLAAIRYMIFSLIGSGLFLLGVVFLYNITGHLLMPDMKSAIAVLAESGEYRVPLSTSICLITVGLAIKSGMFPFHYWMPDTYGYATPCSSGILSGLVSKGYIFFLLKVIFSVFGAEVFYASGVQNVLYVFGMCGIIMGSIGAIRENDIYRMLAHSSSAQIGYIYLGIGISPAMGVTAALFHILAHAVTKPALFLSASRLVDAAGGSKRFRDLHGAAHAAKLAGVTFTIGAFSMIGIPLTMVFMSKYMLALAALETQHKMVLPLIVLALSTLLNTFYFARTVIRLYNVPKKEFLPAPEFRDQSSFAVSAVASVVLNLTAGIFASPLIGLLERGLEIFGKVG